MRAAVVELVPAQPPTAERAQALAALAHGLMLVWRFDESLAFCEQALALARAVGAHAVERRAALDLGRDLAYLGRADEGLQYLRQALVLAGRIGDPLALMHAYVSLSDVLMMLGRPQESARTGEQGLEAVGRYGLDSTVLVSNTIEALLAIGEWDKADSMSAAALRAITPNAEGWLALAEAEYARACGVAPPESWSAAAGIWARLERPPLAAYCRWREAEALVTAGASRTEAAAPLREAHAVAVRIGAAPLLREIELLAQLARLDLTPPQAAFSPGKQAPEETLGLTRREGEVLNLLARGYTNREIAAILVISVKTASVHVSHILHKLGAPNRLEAAAIAHRLAPPSTGDLDEGADRSQQAKA